MYYLLFFSFFSGSITPSRDSINNFEESTPLTFRPIPVYCSNTSSYSFFLKRPLFTNTQNKLSPIALSKSTAATLESTPPDKS